MGRERIVVKAGTNVVTSESGELDMERLKELVDGIVALKKEGKEVILVTSGAIAGGMGKLGMKDRPREVAVQQACAAVGQGALLGAYEELFGKYGIAVAQVLLTSEDLADKNRYLNVRNALEELLRAGVVPIVNENDVVSTNELEHSKKGSIVFGDNDALSALVAGKVKADLLVMLTDVDGLYDDDPRREGAKLIREVRNVTSDMLAYVGKKGKRGRGGMGSKLNAAKMAAASGVRVVIANGRMKGAVGNAVAGAVGTVFLPTDKLSGKEKWIAFAASVRGTIMVDERAGNALVKNGASLLAVGVRAIEGEFEKGDVVEVRCGKKPLARGRVNYASDELRGIAGKRSAEIERIIGVAREVIDRENLVLV